MYIDNRSQLVVPCSSIQIGDSFIQLAPFEVMRVDEPGRQTGNKSKRTDAVVSTKERRASDDGIGKRA